MNNIPNFNTVRYGKHSISYFKPYLWSKLPKEIRNISSLTKFRPRIKKRNIVELVDNSNVRIAIYATLNFFLVLVSLFISIHSYHTFIDLIYTTIFITVSILFLCPVFSLCPQLPCKLNILTHK